MTVELGSLNPGNATRARDIDPGSDRGSGSGSTSTSCSGTVNGRYFYIYAYQYAYVYNGEVGSESHSFSMSGFLGDERDWQMLRRASDRHVVYRKGDELLAIPYVNSADGIWYHDGIAAPGERWTRLCP